VRGIDYTPYNGHLYSIADNGIVRLWDIQKEKIVKILSTNNLSYEDVKIFNIFTHYSKEVLKKV